MLINKIITRMVNLIRLSIWKLRGLNTAYRHIMLGRDLDITNPNKLELNHNVKIYKHNTIYISQHGHVSIGQDSHIAPYGYLLIANNKLIIGNKVAIGPFCSIFCHSNYYANKEDFTSSYIDKDVTIGNNVFIGAHTVILPGSIIGDNVVIGANSVISGILSSNNIYAGNPIKLIKSLGE